MGTHHERLKVLLVEDNSGDALLIREMLLGGTAPFSVHWAQRLEQALEYLRGARPDAVLLDLNLEDSAGLETFDTLHRDFADLPVIILSGNDDEEFALSAVRHGAEDYLAKNGLTPEAVTRCLRHTIERCSRRAESPFPSSRKPQARVMGFVGAKGGVGTTTVALNVAAALAGRGHAVSLAELRAYPGTLAHHFQQPPHKNLSSMLEKPAHQVNELELNATSVKHSSGLRVLFGPQRSAESQSISSEHARAIVNGLARGAGFLVLDLPREPTEATREALQSCDFIGLVLDREGSCLRAARDAMSQIRAWGVKALVAAVVVHRTPLVRPVEMQAISNGLGVGIAGLIPPAPDECVLAQQAGMPVVSQQVDTQQNTSLLVSSFEELAGRLADDQIVLRAIAS